MGYSGNAMKTVLSNKRLLAKRKTIFDNKSISLSWEGAFNQVKYDQHNVALEQQKRQRCKIQNLKRNRIATVKGILAFVLTLIFLYLLYKLLVDVMFSDGNFIY